MSSHNSHDHPLAQKGEFLKNSGSTKHSRSFRGFMGFCPSFLRGFFFIPGGKACAFNSITIN